MKYLQLKLAAVVLLFLVVTLMPTNNCAAACQDCLKNGEGAIKKTINSLSAALMGQKEILFVRKLSNDEIKKQLRPDVFDMAKIFSIQAKYNIYIFDALRILNGANSFKYAIVLSQFSITNPSSDHPTGTSFLPAENSMWIFIDPKRISTDEKPEDFIKSKEAMRIDIDDSSSGTVPIGVNNYLGINTENLFDDVKNIFDFLKVPGSRHLPSMKTGLGNEILKKIVKEELEGKGSVPNGIKNSRN